MRTDRDKMRTIAQFFKEKCAKNLKIFLKIQNEKTPVVNTIKRDMEDVFLELNIQNRSAQFTRKKIKFVKRIYYRRSA